MILALDGGENIGWALFTDDGQDVERGVIRQEVFYGKSTGWDDPGFEFIGDNGAVGDELIWAGYGISTLVVEGIRHNPNINQGGSQRWESQVEGTARILCRLFPCKLVVQRPVDVLTVTLMHEGMEWPRTKTGNKKHLPDDLAAWLHGRYYLRSIGVVE